MGNRSQVSLGTHLTARYRQTEGATFSDSHDPWDMEAHVDLSPPPLTWGLWGQQEACRGGSRDAWNLGSDRRARLQSTCRGGCGQAGRRVLGLSGRTGQKSPH